MSNAQKPQDVIPATPAPEKPADDTSAKPKEYGGPKGLEPTRYGDWEKGGRCIDF
ncbi:MAG: hypothetical protein K0Q70_705 [Rhodospirillales bacterium]|jgi:hypothetical protein|nr:hypothetical protein [Rhodospirillales bacterium]